MEDQLRRAVDQLGDPDEHGTARQSVFQAIEEAILLVDSTPEPAVTECLCSPELVLLLASEHGPLCSAAVRLVKSVVQRLGSGLRNALDDPDGFLELLDELVYKLSTISDSECARLIVTVLMLMLESDADVLELICQKYRGIRPVLKRWHGNGFDLLLLKFGGAVVSSDLELAETEHRRRAATLIQAVYRGHRLRRRLADATGTIARLQRRIRQRQRHAARKRLLQQQEENAAFCSTLQRQQQRRQHTERVLKDLSSISPDKVPQYLTDRREAAAGRLQTAWRAYLVRRRLKETQPQQRRRRAAVTVQRWWRHCLIRLRADRDTAGPPLRLTVEDVEKYQRQIDSAVEAARQSAGPDAPLPSREELQRRLTECHSALVRTARRLERDGACRRRCRLLLAQTEAVCALLELPAGQAPLEEFWCPGRRQAARARLLHQRAAARAAAPWWQRLDEEYDDGYH